MRGALLAIAIWAGAAPAGAACRQALALGLDVSASVDEAEYALQMGGLAAALSHPDVQAALFVLPETPVWLSVFTWSGAESQRLILDWTAVPDMESLERVRFAVATAPRPALSPSTGVGAAMLYGHALMERLPGCWRYTLDLAGDGLNNSGLQPRDLALPPLGAPYTVNALVIGLDADAGWDGGDPGIAELTAWFRADVVRGPDAFAEAALGYEDFEAAMTRKLLKELRGLVIGRAPGAGFPDPGPRRNAQARPETGG